MVPMQLRGRNLKVMLGKEQQRREESKEKNLEQNRRSTTTGRKRTKIKALTLELMLSSATNVALQS